MDDVVRARREWPSDLEPMARTSVLSPSERAVLGDAADGMTMLESATGRCKSVATVKSQRHAIIIKLDARNIAHAVAMLTRDTFGTFDREAPSIS